MGTNADYQGRIEDDRFTTGQGRYVGDIAMDNLAHAVVVRSPYAHAVLQAVETAEAAAAPGVLAVYAAADLAAAGIGDLPCGVKHPRPDGETAFQASRRVLARERCRYLGEPVALVIAETRQAALDAAELVVIDADEQDVVTDTVAATREGAIQVWPEVPDNIAFVWSKGDTAAIAATLSSAHHVARLGSHVTRVLAHTMEPRGVLAYVDDGGRMVVHPSSQSPYPLRAGLAAMLGLPADNIRILAGDVGGSFGMKAGVYPEDVLACFAARQLGRPVRWIADRIEGFVSDEHARDVRMHVELGPRRGRQVPRPRRQVRYQCRSVYLDALAWV